MASRFRGVSLVEMLVSLAVLSVVVAILVPAIRGAWATSRKSTDVVNLRSTHQEFYHWGAAHDDHFLNAGPPPPEKDFFIEFGGCVVLGAYMMQDTYWPLALAGWTGSGSATWHSSRSAPIQLAAINCSLSGIEYVAPSAFVYSRAMLAAPQLWFPENCGLTGAAREPFYRFVRWGETAYPSQKGLLYDSAALANDSGAAAAAVVFVDGSAEVIDWARSAALPEGDCNFEPLARTPRGVLGRDFNR